MQYEEAVRYIEDIPKFTEKHTFEHTREFMRRLGNPCRTKKVLHVAGTNGKGSVCAYMQAILLCCSACLSERPVDVHLGSQAYLSEGPVDLHLGGQTDSSGGVGLFTSPHLVKLNERIRINGTEISDEDFLKVFEKVLSVVHEMEADGIAHPSYFEFLYGMGMTAFERAGVEYVILETGLGGRLDATNSFETPLVSVITSIGLDHTAILGDTISQIAAEKAGIIRRGVPVIYDGSVPEAAAVIRQTAEKVGAPCREVANCAFKILEITEKDIAFSLVNEYDNNTVWRVRGTGVYQAMNATLAITAMKEIFGHAREGEISGRIDDVRWSKALSEVTWPGRMEEVLPGVILDGAHNLAAVRKFVESVRAQDALSTAEGQERTGNATDAKKRVILFSAVAEKDYRHMIEELLTGVPADAYVVTGIQDKRGAGISDLAAVFARYTKSPIYPVADLSQAFDRAMEEKGEDGRLYCLGSLYLIGELKALIGGRHA
ncbi:folylpolyglutamate synthase/dihydrofolate synthase family protein [Roseburia hominis]